MQQLADDSSVSIQQHTDESAISMQQLSDDSSVSIQQHIDDSAVSMQQRSDDSAVCIQQFPDYNTASIQHPSLIARRWVGRQTRWWPRHKAIYFSWFGPEFFCLLLGPPVFNCWFSFAPVFQWCFSVPRGSPDVGRNTFLSSPLLCFIIVFICDLFEPKYKYRQQEQATACFMLFYVSHVRSHYHYSCHITETEGEVGIPLNRFKPPPPSIFILTVPRRYFCCVSLLLLVLAVRIYTLVQLLC